jgi:alpha/beta superfamily hydrolase
MTPISFSVTPSIAPKLLQRDLKRQKIQNIVLSILTCGVYFLGSRLMNALKKKLVPLAYMPSIRFPKQACDELTQVKIETLDHVKLDAREWVNPSGTGKWMIFFCGNGTVYEDLLHEKRAIAENLNVNLLVFNYRSVGHSTGELLYGRQLTIDASSVIDYIKHQKGIKESDITLWGHSMGGGVAAAATKYYPQVKLINDRSYSKISSVVPLLSPLVKAAGLEIDAINPWMQLPDNQKMVVYHRADGVIPYKTASLYHAVKERMKKLHPEGRIKKSVQGRSTTGLADSLKPRRLKLSLGNGGIAAHCYPLHDPNPAIEAWAKECGEFKQKASELIFPA